jgi:hypothetical protein
MAWRVLIIPVEQNVLSSPVARRPGGSSIRARNKEGNVYCGTSYDAVSVVASDGDDLAWQIPKL